MYLNGDQTPQLYFDMCKCITVSTFGAPRSIKEIGEKYLIDSIVLGLIIYNTPSTTLKFFCHNL